MVVQKAYKQLETEGILLTASNVKSIISVNENIRSVITAELTSEAVLKFIMYAKSINMSFKNTIELISALWD